jgi:hypothetical protein
MVDISAPSSWTMVTTRETRSSVSHALANHVKLIQARIAADMENETRAGPLSEVRRRDLVGKLAACDAQGNDERQVEE